MRPWSHIVIIAVMLTLYSASKHTKNAPWPNLATQYNITKITHWRCQKIQYVMDMQLESWVIKTNIWHSVIAFRLHSQTQQQQQQYRIHRRLGLFLKKRVLTFLFFFSYSNCIQKKRVSLTLEQNSGWGNTCLYTTCFQSCAYFGGRWCTDTSDHFFICKR